MWQGLGAMGGGALGGGLAVTGNYPGKALHAGRTAGWTLKKFIRCCRGSIG